MADLATAALFVFAIAAVTGFVGWTRACLRQQGLMADRIGALERALLEQALTTGDVAKAEAPGEGLPVGAAIHGIAPALADGRPILIVFVSSGCPPCAALLSEVDRWQARLGQAAQIRVVSRDERDGRNIADGFRARWTPAGVLVGSAGRIASTVRYGNDGVRELFEALAGCTAGAEVNESALNRALGSRLGDTALVVGDVTPAPELLMAGGRSLALEGTLHLFWDPTCRFCQAMADDIAAIDAAPLVGSPRVVFVDSDVAPLFGARGTPTAVLVDGHGKIASTVAVGRDAILSLVAPGRAGLPSR